MLARANRAWAGAPGPCIVSAEGCHAHAQRRSGRLVEHAGGKFRLEAPARRPAGVNLLGAIELRVPPPIVALLAAAGMWFAARMESPVRSPAAWQLVVSAALAAAGLAFDLLGLVAFRRASTTVHPMKPQASTTLVRSGVYRFTRNPMYVGLLLVLGAWAAYLGSPWAWLGPFATAVYLRRFQIMPEERVLQAKFGDAYTRYRASVRRWV